jgi:hypothetical protein
MTHCLPCRLSIHDCPMSVSIRLQTSTAHRAGMIAVRPMRCWRGESNPLCKSLLT